MDAKQIIEAIKAGKFSPSEMEDMVYAMEYAYQDHFSDINLFISTPLEYVADDMVKARECVAPSDMDGVDDANSRALEAHFGDVMTQVNALSIRAGV